MSRDVATIIDHLDTGTALLDYLSRHNITLHLLSSSLSRQGHACRLRLHEHPTTSLNLSLQPPPSHASRVFILPVGQIWLPHMMGPVGASWSSFAKDLFGTKQLQTTHKSNGEAVRKRHFSVCTLFVKWHFDESQLQDSKRESPKFNNGKNLNFSFFVRSMTETSCA
jgi:hypothetical protein